VPAIKSETKNGLLTVRQTLEGDRVRLALEGELDLASVEIAEESLLSALASGGDVLIDLDKLVFIDSTGISLLVMALRMKENGLSFVPSASAEVGRLLGLTGLDERMEFVPAGETLSALPSPPDEDLPPVPAA
jgi:anti-anti-sigma factor